MIVDAIRPASIPEKPSLIVCSCVFQLPATTDHNNSIVPTYSQTTVNVHALTASSAGNHYSTRSRYDSRRSSPRQQNSQPHYLEQAFGYLIESLHLSPLLLFCRSGPKSIAQLASKSFTLIEEPGWFEGRHCADTPKRSTAQDQLTYSVEVIFTTNQEEDPEEKLTHRSSSVASTDSWLRQGGNQQIIHIQKTKRQLIFSPSITITKERDPSLISTELLPSYTINIYPSCQCHTST